MRVDEIDGIFVCHEIDTCDHELEDLGGTDMVKEVQDSVPDTATGSQMLWIEKVAYIVFRSEPC